MTGITKICMIGIICVLLSLLLRESGGKLSFAVKMACSAFIFISALTTLAPVLDFAKETISTSAVSPYAQILLKSLGIAFATAVASDICKDFGEASVASGIELAGKAEIILLSLPAIKEIIALAGEIIG